MTKTASQLIRKVPLTTRVLTLIIILLVFILFLREKQINRLYAIRLASLERRDKSSFAEVPSHVSYHHPEDKNGKQDNGNPQSASDTSNVHFELNISAKRYPAIFQKYPELQSYGGISYDVVSKDGPRAMRLHNMASAEDCEIIKKEAAVHIRRSQVVGDNAKGVVSNVRTSNGMFITFPLEADQRLRRKAAMITGVPMENLEATQVLRYAPGEFYRVHPDYFVHGSPHLFRGGQRFATVLTWLNEIPPEKGGETRFPFASPSLTVKPGPVGDSVLFYSTNEEGVEDVRSNHEGVPPADGAEKWVAVIWIRQSRFE